MQKKTTLMRYFVFGISIFFLQTFISCDKAETEYILTTNFVYKNMTSEVVEIKLYNNLSQNTQNVFVSPNAELEFVYKYNGSRTGVGEPFPGSSKIILHFETSNLCLENYIKLKDSKEYDNFSEEMYGKSDNTLIYNIDSEEFDLATPCP